MEYWSDGGLEYWKKYFVTHHSNTYSYLCYAVSMKVKDARSLSPSAKEVIRIKAVQAVEAGQR